MNSQPSNIFSSLTTTPNKVIYITILLLELVLIKVKSETPNDLKITNGVAFEKVTPLSFIHSDLVVNRVIPIFDFATNINTIKIQVHNTEIKACGFVQDAYDNLKKLRTKFTKPLRFEDAHTACESLGGYLPSIAKPFDLDEYRQASYPIKTELPQMIWAGVIRDSYKRAYFYHRDQSFVRDTTSMKRYIFINHNCHFQTREMHTADELINSDNNYYWYYDSNNTLYHRNPACQHEQQEYPQFKALCIIPPKSHAIKVAETLKRYCELITRKHLYNLNTLKWEIKPLFDSLDTIIQKQSIYGFVHKLKESKRPVRSLVTDNNKTPKVLNFTCPPPIHVRNIKNCKLQTNSTRQSRSAFAVGLATFGIARAITQDVLGQIQINDLEFRLDDAVVRLDQLNNSVLNIADQIQTIDKKAALLELRLDAIESQVKGMMRLRIIDESFTKIVNNLYTHYLTIRNVITSLMERRTTVHVMPFNDLSILDALLRKQHIFSYTTKDYTKMETELVEVNRTHLSISIIIPLWENDKYMVYRVYPIPDLSYKLIPKIDANIVVMTPNNKQFTSLTFAQLGACLTNGCKRPPLSKQTQLSACGAGQIIGKSTDGCTWENFGPKRYFAQTERGFLFAVPNRYHVKVTCHNLPSFDTTIDKTGFLEIPAGCTADILSLTGSHSITIDGPKGFLEVDQIKSANIAELFVENVLAPVRVRMDEMYSFKKHITESIANYEILVDVYREQHTVALVLGGTIITLICCIMACCAYNKTTFLEHQLVPKKHQAHYFRKCKVWCPSNVRHYYYNSDDGNEIENDKKHENENTTVDLYEMQQQHDRLPDFDSPIQKDH